MGQFGLNVNEAPENIEAYIYNDMARAVKHIQLWVDCLAQQPQDKIIKYGEYMLISGGIELNQINNSSVFLRFEMGSCQDEYKTLIDFRNISVAIDFERKKLILNGEQKIFVHLSRMASQTNLEDPLDEIMEHVWDYQNNGQFFIQELFKHANLVNNLGVLAFKD